MNKKYLWFLPIAVVVGSIGLGLYYAGSPNEARKTRRDDQRVQDVSAIQYAVEAFYWSQDKLPESLAELDANMDTNKPYVSYYSVARKDPTTGEPYKYQKIDTDTFDVCAKFETKKEYDINQMYYGMSGQPFNASHDIGEKCFSYTASTSTRP